MSLKSSTLDKIVISVIVLSLSIQTTQTSQEFTDGETSELLLNEHTKGVQTPRIFFNNSIALDTRTVLILAAIFGPLLAAIPILVALLSNRGGNDNTPSYGYGGGSGYGGGQHGGSSGGYGYARNSAPGVDDDKIQRNFWKRSALADTESYGKSYVVNITIIVHIENNLVVYHKTLKLSIFVQCTCQ